MIYPDEVTQLIVVRADVCVHHFFGLFTDFQTTVYVVERHVGIVHTFVQAFLGKAVVVVPRLHVANHFFHVHRQYALVAVILQHGAQLRFGEAYQRVEQRRGGDVGSDIETTRHVIQRDGAYTGDEHTFQCHAVAGSEELEHVEEVAEEAFAVGGLTIRILSEGGKDGIGEVVVLVDDEVDTQAQPAGGAIDIIQPFGG